MRLSDKEKANQEGICRALLRRHDHEFPIRERERALVMENCGCCTLNGAIHGGVVTEAPNYGGFATIYLAAGVPMVPRILADELTRAAAENPAHHRRILDCMETWPDDRYAGLGR